MYAVSGGEAGKKYSFASVNRDNVILETVKQAECGEGTILRLYEAHNAKTKVTVKVPCGVKAAYITNLLEEIEEELTVKDGEITFVIKPYEIMTILLK
jgi:alpha-mannosidase